MRLLVVAVVSVLLLRPTTGQNRIDVNPQYVVELPAVYSPNPNHIWNQVYDVLLVREDKAGGNYGVDSLDPLLWWKTKHLLEGPSHEQALMMLDEFLRTHAENEIRDPIKRVLLERDLWAVFDWSASSTDDHLSQRRELQVRLAEVMRRLALTSDEILSLALGNGPCISVRACILCCRHQEQTKRSALELFGSDNREGSRPVRQSGYGVRRSTAR